MIDEDDKSRTKPYIYLYTQMNILQRRIYPYYIIHESGGNGGRVALYSADSQKRDMCRYHMSSFIVCIYLFIGYSYVEHVRTSMYVHMYNSIGWILRLSFYMNNN